MHTDEKIVFEYLRNQFGNDIVDIVYEPEPNNPPDFLVNSSIAVEVRRLNQNDFSKEKPEGLDTFSIGLDKAFLEVFESFNGEYTGNSYFVCYEFQRSPTFTIRRAKKVIRLVLKKFLESNVKDSIYEVEITPEITISILVSKKGTGKLFSYGASGDFDVGGNGDIVYADNIRHCILEKSTKIREKLHAYPEWWLFLVDHMCLGLEPKIIEKLVPTTGLFDKVVVLSFDGRDELLTLSKK